MHEFRASTDDFLASKGERKGLGGDPDHGGQPLWNKKLKNITGQKQGHGGTETTRVVHLPS